MSWEQDKDQKHLWKYQERLIEVMSFTNDDDPDLKCVYVRFLHNGDWLSNYFITREKMTTLAFALEMVDRYQNTKEEK